ncbi:MAG TPA: tetratricopeptide repeat protein, partial [Thermoanaerobaculia bacterium]|nr:tetratricopeptide repeat protein [Thermoanaerobaculia bacterium]
MTTLALLIALAAAPVPPAVPSPGPPSPSDAERSLEQMANSHPESPLYQKALAQAAARRGAYAEAIQHYQKVVALVPRDLDARLHVAELYAWTRDLDRSIVLYRDLLALDPENLRAKLGLALVLRWSQRYVDAERLYQEVLKAEPDNGEAIKGLAQAHGLAGDFPQALALLDRAIALFPDDADLYVERGTVLAWQGRLKEAATTLQKALSLAPKSASAHRTLGDIHTWRKDFAHSAESYRKALDLDPGSVATALDLGGAYAADGRADLAEDAVKAALRLSPNDRKALDLLQQIRQAKERNAASVIKAAAEQVRQAGALVLAATLLLLGWVSYRRRRLVVYRPRLYRLLYRALLPGLALFLIASFLLRKAFGITSYLEIAEPLVIVALGLGILPLFWERLHSTSLAAEAVMVVGAHPDDIELGAAGFLLRLKEEGARVYGLVMSNGEKGTEQAADRRPAEAQAAAQALGLDGLWVLDFPDTLLREHVTGMKTAIEEKIERLGVGLVITHSFR